MAVFERFARRHTALERLDTGDYTPAEFEGCLIELRRVNRWLGDSRALRSSLLAEIDRERPSHQVSVLDVGAGSGELLRIIADWAVTREIDVSLVGLELNRRSAEAIAEESRGYKNIQVCRGDAGYLPFSDKAFDYVISSLLTHHFNSQTAVACLREMGRVAKRRVFVIDLHRHPVSYYLYTTLGRLFLYNRLVREDGALSILRGFKPPELSFLASRAGLEENVVERSFPFRLVLSARPPLPNVKSLNRQNDERKIA